MLNRPFRNVLLIILVFCCLAVDGAFAQQDTVGLSPLQMADIKKVNEIALSSSGRKAIYTLRVPANPLQNNEPASYHLYVADLDSGTTSPYISSMSVSNIAFRPHHRTITFLASSSSEQPAALYEISTDGGEAHRIFSFPTAIADYEWAPDGTHLAFMAKDTVHVDRSKLPYHPEIYEENLKQRRGYVTNLGMEDQPAHQLQVEGSIYQMHWSPDGQKLAIAVAPSPLVDDYYMHQTVKIVDRYGQQVYSTVDHRGKLGAIRWSPDGSKLAMLAGAGLHDPVAGRLFVVPTDSGNPTQLQPQFKGMFEQVRWADSNTLYYLTSKGVWSTYGRIKADGSQMETIVDKGKLNLSSFDRAANGNTIFTVDSPAHPTELYRLGSADNKLARLSNSNPWLDSLQLAMQEVVSWKAPDGTELQGILMYPVNFDKDKDYPLITTVHGGPESHYNNGWVTGYSDPGQVAASQDYFVFYPNYRGSTGRGETFAKSSQGDMAGAEFDDIVAGIDELIKVGVVDSSRVGVTGGSYGGYATGWMATRYTDRFAAGVMFVGISNNISKWGSSDIPEELYLVHARERIWDDYMSFLKRSPIYYAGQADTPLLIMAGKEDTRVDPSQSYELYRHIKTRTSTPVRLVLYPGEGHGNARATSRLDYNLRMMRWFNEYLKGQHQQPDPALDLNQALPGIK